MPSANRKVLLVFISAALWWTSAAQVSAHRDRGPDDPCRRQVGASLLHLTLYQAQFDPVAEYCEKVPRAGKTVIVVDVTPGELREAALSLDLTPEGDTVGAGIVLSLPPRVYERGVLDTQVVLEEGRGYVARVGLKTADGRHVFFSFPIQVAAWYERLIVPGLVAVAVVALMIISVVRYRLASRQDDALAQQLDAV